MARPTSTAQRVRRLTTSTLAATAAATIGAGVVMVQGHKGQAATTAVTTTTSAVEAPAVPASDSSAVSSSVTATQSTATPSTSTRAS